MTLVVRNQQDTISGNPALVNLNNVTGGGSVISNYNDPNRAQPIDNAVGGVFFTFQAAAVDLFFNHGIPPLSTINSASITWTSGGFSQLTTFNGLVSTPIRSFNTYEWWNYESTEKWKAGTSLQAYFKLQDSINGTIVESIGANAANRDIKILPTHTAYDQFVTPRIGGKFDLSASPTTDFTSAVVQVRKLFTFNPQLGDGELVAEIYDGMPSGDPFFPVHPGNLLHTSDPVDISTLTTGVGAANSTTFTFPDAPISIDFEGFLIIRASKSWRQPTGGNIDDTIGFRASIAIFGATNLVEFCGGNGLGTGIMLTNSDIFRAFGSITAGPAPTTWTIPLRADGVPITTPDISATVQFQVNEITYQLVGTRNAVLGFQVSADPAFPLPSNDIREFRAGSAVLTVDFTPPPPDARSPDAQPETQQRAVVQVDTHGNVLSFRTIESPVDVDKLSDPSIDTEASNAGAVSVDRETKPPVDAQPKAGQRVVVQVDTCGNILSSRAVESPVDVDKLSHPSVDTEVSDVGSVSAGRETQPMRGTDGSR